MDEKARKLYERALKEGNRRFGSSCSHTIIRNGRCVNCLHQIVR